MKKIIFILNLIIISLAFICVINFKETDYAELVESSESVSIEPTMESKGYIQHDTYMENYFAGLTQNLGKNIAGSCGYVALGMLLSYYDSFLDDSIIPEKYDAISTGSDTDIINRHNSPGYKCEMHLDFDKKEDYYNAMEQLSEDYLHAKLLTIGKKNDFIKIVKDDYSFGTNTDSRKIILESYLDEMNITGYEIETYSDEKHMEEYIKDNIDAGYPVLVGVSDPNNYYVPHALIVYAYDENNLYGNMGWVNSTNSHFRYKTMYSKYNGAMVLKFPNKQHTHSYNYEVQHGDHVDRYCYCNNNIRTYKSTIDNFDEQPSCFDGTYTVPSWATEIGDNAFKDVSEVKDIIFEPDSKLTRIGSYAFYSCNNISEITIPKNVTKIDDFAFNLCQKLKYVNFEPGSQLKIIGDQAFAWSGLRSFGIPDGVTTLGDSVFYNIPYLTNVLIPNSVEYIGKNAISGESLFVKPAQKVTIFTECKSKKSGWDDTWNGDSEHRTVFWGCTFSENNTYVDLIATDFVRLTDAGSPWNIQFYPPTRRGYTFDGWYNNPNFTGQKYTQKSITDGLQGPLYTKWVESPLGNI